MSRRRLAVGVDGCRAGWAAFVGDAAGGFEFRLVPAMTTLLASLGRPALVLVDIPVGLAQAGSPARTLDALARARLGPRAASVFPVPCREALAASGHAEASAVNRRVTGKGLSIQAFHIAAKIDEVDRLLRAGLGRGVRLRESHPELAFAALAGGAPMRHPKRSRAGRDERMAVLRRHLPATDALAAAALAASRRREVAADDVVDALVLALTASLPPARLAVLRGEPARDAHGIAMEMVSARVGG